MPDTYISQFSGEEIDSALRAAQIISGADTPAELRKKLEIRGDTIPVSATDPTPVSEALTASGGGVNPNLLDNWYFGRPVNQRGQTEWASSASAYVPCVDRWNWWGQYAAGSTLKLLDDGLQLIGEPNVAGLYQHISQKIEKDRLPIGAAVTLSALVKSESDASIILSIDGKNYTTVAVQANVWELITYTLNAPSVEQTYDISIQRNTAGTTFTVKAAKLELGSTQTLAHKEGDKWVLNEIPDYGEQLRRCQRYARAYKCLLGQTFLPLGAYRSDRKAVSFALPTSSFRAVPTVSTLNDIFQLFDGTNVYGITSLAVTDYSDGLVTIYAYTSQSFEDGKVLWLFSNNGTLLLSADL